MISSAPKDHGHEVADDESAGLGAPLLQNNNSDTDNDVGKLDDEAAKNSPIDNELYNTVFGGSSAAVAPVPEDAPHEQHRMPGLRRPSGFFRQGSMLAADSLEYCPHCNLSLNPEWKRVANRMINSPSSAGLAFLEEKQIALDLKRKETTHKDALHAIETYAVSDTVPQPPPTAFFPRISA